MRVLLLGFLLFHFANSEHRQAQVGVIKKTAAGQVSDRA